MEKEIVTKFDSCLEEDTLERETLIFKTEEGKELGRVTLRQLKRGEIMGNENQPFEEMAIKAVETWTFTDSKNKPLEITLENLKKLSSRKKVGAGYVDGIFNHIIDAVVRMNFVDEISEKNSGRPLSSDS